MRQILLIVTACVGLLLVLIGAKVMLEDRCAPLTSGIHGALGQRGVQVYLLGSSHTRQGYDIATLERLTGTKDFAVAYDGLDPAGMVPLVRALLPVWDRTRPTGPRLLVLEAYSANLARIPELEEPRLFFDAPPRTKLEIARNYLKSHPHRAGAWLDLLVLATNRGTETILTYPMLDSLTNRFSYNGGYRGKTVAGFPGQFSQLAIQMPRRVADPVQVAAMAELVSLAKQHGVAVMLVEPPMPAPVEAQPGIQAMQRQFRKLAAELAVVYVQGADGFSTNDAAMFADSNHLSTAGREAYTARFAGVVNGWLHGHCSADCN